MVEDEHILAMIIKDTFDAQGFNIRIAADGMTGLTAFRERRPDVVVADVMMPRMDGFELVRHIRKIDQHTPVLFLTARSSMSDVVNGFELGANDYLKKPFGMQELIVRIKALAGRFSTTSGQSPSRTEWLEVGSYALNPTTQHLRHDGYEQELSYRETEILRRLIMNVGQVVHTQDILMELWGDDSYWNTRSLHVFITKLRHKLSADPRLRIVNIRGVGYKLIVS